MKAVCWVLPVKQEKVPLLYEYMDQLEVKRRAAYVASDKRIGIDREMWFLWEQNGTSYIVLYMQGEDMSTSLRSFQESTEEFEVWSREVLWQITDAWPDPIWADSGTPGVASLLSAFDVSDDDWSE